MQVLSLQKILLTLLDLLLPGEEQISLIVNCTGIGAQTFVKDDNLEPRRGVIVLLPPDSRFIGKCIAEESNEESLSYMIGREDCIILGGTCNVTNNKTTKLSEIEHIIQKNLLLIPELGDIGK